MADHEHLHRQHADIAEGLGDAGGDAARLGGKLRGNLGRHARDFQNMVAVLVFGHLEAFHLAVGRTRRHHRYFALEADEAFEDAGRLAQGAPGGGRVAA